MADVACFCAELVHPRFVFVIEQKLFLLEDNVKMKDAERIYLRKL